MKLLKRLRWAYNKRQLEKNLAAFCAVEYRPVDRLWAFHVAMEKHKTKYLGDS